MRCNTRENFKGIQNSTLAQRLLTRGTAEVLQLEGFDDGMSANGCQETSSALRFEGGWIWQLKFVVSFTGFKRDALIKFLRVTHNAGSQC